MSRGDDEQNPGRDSAASDDFRTAESNEQNGSHRTALSRRTYLKLAGVAVVGGGSALSLASDVVEIQPPKVFGYGGNPLSAGETALVSRADAREQEPNNDREVATHIETGSPITGELDGEEVDWFTFEADARDELTIEFSREDEDGVTGVALYGRAGQFLDQVYVGSNHPTRIREIVESAGSYFVQLIDVQDGSGEYTLTVSVTPGETQPPTEQTPTEPPETTTATTTATETAEQTPAETTTETETSTTTTQTTTSTPTETATETQTATPTPTATPTTTTPAATSTETATTTAATTATTAKPTTQPETTTAPADDEYGEQSYGDYGYGGVHP